MVQDHRAAGVKRNRLPQPEVTGQNSKLRDANMKLLNPI